MATFLIQTLGSVGALSYLNADLGGLLKPKSESQDVGGGPKRSGFLPTFIAPRSEDWNESSTWGLLSSLTSLAYLSSLVYSLYKLSALASREHSYQQKGLLPKRRAKQRLEDWKWVPHTLKHGRLVNRDGLLLALYEWPAKTRASPCKGVVLLVHGIGQHVMAYAETASLIAQSGYTVLAIDLQGHGASEGDRYYFKRFEDLGADVLALTAFAQHQYKDADLFLMGASSGALIAVDAASKLSRDGIKGLILVGPSFAPATRQSKPDWRNTLERGLSDYLPKVSLNSAMDEENVLVHSEESRDVLENDTLLAHGSLPARSSWELKCASATSMRLLFSDARLPRFYVIQGDQDTQSEAVKPGEHKQSIPQGRHLLLLDEKTRSECVNLTVKWMDTRLSPQAVASQWASSVTSAFKQTISQKLSTMSNS